MANASIWDGTKWVSIMGPEGPQGEPGKDGSGVTIQGTATAWPPSATPAQGDMYLLGDPVPVGSPAGSVPGDGVVWTGTAWQNVGSIRGPKGDAGADGQPGAPGTDGAVGADGVGFTFKGEWDAGATYQPNDVVTSNGTTFVFVAGGGDEETTDASAWSPLVSSGKDGVGLTFRGEFDANENYSNNDVVTLFGQTYIVVNQPTRGIITDPANDLKVLAEKGERGADGVKGDTGADGAKGADGTIGADGRSVEVYVQASQPAGAVKGDIWIDP